jgi:small subunit ribosomal protein S4e
VGKLGGSKHLRSLVAPEFWPIPVKERFWTVKPSPGPHPIEASIPLAILIRDMMRYATTLREARKIIAKGLIEVDGRVRRNYKYPVGLFDVIRLVPVNKYYRVVPDNTFFMKLVEISPEEARLKPLRIENKTTVKGGQIQLNLSDGSNIIVRVSDPRNPAEDVYDTLGTVIVEIPGRRIVDYIPLREGNYAVISGGSNVGKHGKVVSIVKGMKRYRSIITLKGADGSLIQTSLDYAYVVGRDNPVVKLG